MRSLIRLILPIFMFLGACAQATPQVIPTLAVSPTSPNPTATVASSAAIAQLAESTASASEETGIIRVVHAAADMPSINVIAGIQAIATNLNYTNSTEPTPFNAGDYVVKVVPSGSGSNDPSLLETGFTLGEAESLVLVIAKQNDQYVLITFPETTQPLNAGESILTVMNAISGATSAQVRQNEGGDLTQAIAFGETETTAILPSGETTLDIQAGDSTQSFVLELNETTHYTLILTGSPESISVVRFSTQAPGRAAIRAIHASETLPAVDVYLDQNVIAEDAAFGRPTTRQDIISGRYTVDVYRAGDDPTNSDSLVSQIVDVPSGENLALLLLGTGDSLTIVPYSEDLSPTPANRSRIAFLNTLERVPTLRIETSGGQLSDIPDMGFGQAPNSTLLTSDTYTFYMTHVGEDEANETVENAQGVQLQPGISYLYLVTGRLDDQPIILSERVEIDESLSSSVTDNQSEQVTTNPAQFRFINAIGDQQPVDFQINDVPAANNIVYGEGSPFIPFAQQNATISVSASGSITSLQVADSEVVDGESYSVIAYGTNQNEVQLWVMSDEDLIFDGRSPHIRLINVSSNTDTLIGLGFSTQDPTPSAGVTVQLNEDLRRSVPGGIQWVVENVAGGSMSPVILMPVGIFDMEILDSSTYQLATTVLNVDLVSGEHYDIISYEEPDTTRIRAFVVHYPGR